MTCGRQGVRTLLRSDRLRELGSGWMDTPLHGGLLLGAA